MAKRKCESCGKAFEGSGELCSKCFDGAASDLAIERTDAALPEKYDSRCKVCASPHRKMIERLAIMPNVSFSEIQRTFDVPRRSVANHVKDHLNHEEAAVRRLIEQEAAALQQDSEEGIRGALSRRVFLAAYIQKSIEALLNGEMELTGKDAMNAILLQDKLDESSGGAALDEINLQFQAFLQAIREMSQFDIDAIQTPFQLQSLLLARTKEILGKGENQPQLEE